MRDGQAGMAAHTGMHIRVAGAIAAAAFSLAGCFEPDCCVVNDGAVDAMPPPSRVEVANVPVTINRDIDLLFAIDDSPGMLEVQTTLKNAFPAFVSQLNGLEGGLPNLHIGVVSSDLGTKGALDASAGPGIGSGPGSCSGNGKSGNLQTNGSTMVSGVFISDTKNTDGTRTLNYSGSLDAAFGAIASLGASGCGFEQPIESVKRALNNNPANAGFVRPNANLAVVMIADEDDCSIAHSTLLGTDSSLGPLQSFRCTRFGVTCDAGGKTPDEMNQVGTKTACHSNNQSPYLMSVADYASFLTGLKANPRNVYVATLTGPRTPVAVELRSPPGGGTTIPALSHSCSWTGATGPAVADPAVRMHELAGLIPRNTIGNVCTNDLAPAMTEIARQVRGLAGDPCLTRDIALPADCLVFELRTGSETPIPSCDGAGAPCYQLVTDPMSCSAGQHLRVNVQRAAAPAPDVVVSVRCYL